MYFLGNTFTSCLLNCIQFSNHERIRCMIPTNSFFQQYLQYSRRAKQNTTAPELSRPFQDAIIATPAELKLKLNKVGQLVTKLVSVWAWVFGMSHFKTKKYLNGQRINYRYLCAWRYMHINTDSIHIGRGTSDLTLWTLTNNILLPFQTWLIVTFITTSHSYIDGGWHTTNAQPWITTTLCHCTI